MKAQFDNEELDILRKHENNELKVSKNKKNDIKNAYISVNDTIQLKAQLNIRLTEKDLRSLKLKEIEIGIPSQNIITALIHKYLENKIELTI
jgi:predicted DNA binding CopG/RHH family protein